MTKNYYINHREIKDEDFCLKLPELDIIINQKCYNSCVGHSFAMAKSILEYNRTNKWMDIDPYMIYGTRYAGEYIGMGMYPYQGAKVLLKDGAYLRRDFNILADGKVPVCRDKSFENPCGNAFEEDLSAIFDRNNTILQTHIDKKLCEGCLSCDEYYTYNF